MRHSTKQLKSRVGYLIMALAFGVVGALGVTGLTSQVAEAQTEGTMTTLTTTGLSPAASTTAPNNVPHGISCPSAGTCFIAGYYSDTSGNILPNVDALSNGSWTPETLPTSLLSNSSSALYGYLQSVSCTSSSYCVAVGQYALSYSSSSVQGAIYTYNGSSWSDMPTPTSGLNPAPPAESSSSPYYSVRLETVTCTSSQNCVAGGTYRDASNTYQLFVETETSGTWTASTIPLSSISPAPASFPSLAVNQISCPTVGNCVMVGTYGTASEGIVGFAATLSGGSWTVNSIPNSGLSPASATGTSTYIMASGVSCPSVGNCVFLGNYSDASGAYYDFVSVLSGGSWTSTTLPTTSISSLFSNPPYVLQGAIYCTSTTNCTVASTYENSASGQDAFLAELSGTTWTESALSTSSLNPTSATGANATETPYAITCTSAGNCTYVGSYATTTGNIEPFTGNTITSLADSSTLPTANLGGSYSDALPSPNGIAPFQWSVASGTLPPGLNLNSSTGTITGSASQIGSFTFIIDATDSNGLVNTYSETIVVSGGGVNNSRLLASTPDGKGYWIASSNGGVFTFGDAAFYGSMGNTHLNAPIVGITSTPDGKGYWLSASDGGVFTFGDAAFYGSMGGTHLNAPIVGITSTPDGKGYWLSASDGGVFTFGDAAFYGSMGGTHLNEPVVGITSTPDGKGYWLVASDGGVFTFGDAAFYGSMGGTHLNEPAVSITSTPDGKGYWISASDGGVFTFGDATFTGSLPASHITPTQWYPYAMVLVLSRHTRLSQRG